MVRQGRKELEKWLDKFQMEKGGNVVRRSKGQPSALTVLTIDLKNQSRPGIQSFHDSTSFLGIKIHNRSGVVPSSIQRHNFILHHSNVNHIACTHIFSLKGLPFQHCFGELGINLHDPQNIFWNEADIASMV